MIQENKLGFKLESQKTAKKEVEDLLRVVKSERPEVYLASRYATKEDRINALLNLMERKKAYYPAELAELWNKKYKCPISRVAVSHYLNILGTSGRIEYRGRGARGKNLYSKP